LSPGPRSIGGCWGARGLARIPGRPPTVGPDVEDAVDAEEAEDGKHRPRDERDAPSTGCFQPPDHFASPLRLLRPSAPGLAHARIHLTALCEVSLPPRRPSVTTQRTTGGPG